MALSGDKITIFIEANIEKLNAAITSAKESLKGFESSVDQLSKKQITLETETLNQKITQIKEQLNELLLNIRITGMDELQQTSSAAEKLRAAIAAIPDTITVSANVSQFLSAITSASEALISFTAEAATIPITTLRAETFAFISAIDSALNTVTALREAISVGVGSIEPIAAVSAFIANIEAAVEAISLLKAEALTKISLTPTANTTTFVSAINAAIAAIDALRVSISTVTDSFVPTANATAFITAINEANAAIDLLKTSAASVIAVTPLAETAAFTTSINEAIAAIDSLKVSLSTVSGGVTLTANTSAFTTSINEATAAITLLESTLSSIPTGVTLTANTAGFVTAINEAIAVVDSLKTITSTPIELSTASNTSAFITSVNEATTAVEALKTATATIMTTVTPVANTSAFIAGLAAAVLAVDDLKASITAVTAAVTPVANVSGFITSITEATAALDAFKVLATSPIVATPLADTAVFITGINEATAAVNALKATLSTLSRTVTLSSNASAFASALTRAATAITTLNAVLAVLPRTVTLTANATAFIAEINRAIVVARELQAIIATLKAPVTLNIDVAPLIAEIERATAAARTLSAELSTLRTRSQLASGGLTQLGSSAGFLNSFFGPLISMIAQFATVIGLIKVTKTASDIEQLRIQLTGMYGSVAEGEKAFQWIAKFAKDTPYDVEQTTKALIQLVNAGINPYDGALQKIADGAARYGRTSQDLYGITLQLSQAWGKNKLQMADIRPLIDRGVQVWDLLAGKLNKTKEELIAMSRAGTLNRREISLLIDAMGEAGQGFSEAKVMSIAGAWSQLGDAMYLAIAKVQQQGGFEWLSNWLRAISNQVPSLAPTFFETFGLVTKAIGTGLKAIKEFYDYASRTFEELGREILGLFGIGGPVDESFDNFASKIAVVRAAVLELSVAIDKLVASARELSGNVFGRIAMAMGDIGSTDALRQRLSDARQTLDIYKQLEQYEKKKILQIEEDRTNMTGQTAPQPVQAPKNITTPENEDELVPPTERMRARLNAVVVFQTNLLTLAGKAKSDVKQAAADFWMAIAAADDEGYENLAKSVLGKEKEMQKAYEGLSQAQVNSQKKMSVDDYDYYAQKIAAQIASGNKQINFEKLLQESEQDIIKKYGKENVSVLKQFYHEAYQLFNLSGDDRRQIRIKQMQADTQAAVASMEEQRQAQRDQIQQSTLEQITLLTEEHQKKMRLLKEQLRQIHELYKSGQITEAVWHEQSQPIHTSLTQEAKTFSAQKVALESGKATSIGALDTPSTRMGEKAAADAAKAKIKIEKETVEELSRIEAEAEAKRMEAEIEAYKLQREKKANAINLDMQQQKQFNEEAISASEAATQEKLAKLELSHRLGMISEKDYMEQMIAIKRDGNNEQQAILGWELEEIKQHYDQLADVYRNDLKKLEDIHKKKEKEMQDHQRKMTAIAKKGAKDVADATRDIYEKQMNKIKDAFEPMKDGMRDFVGDVLSGNKSIGQSFKDMMGNMVINWAQSLTEMFMTQVGNWLMEKTGLAAHIAEKSALQAAGAAADVGTTAAAETAKTGFVAAGAATSKGIKMAEAGSSIMAKAADAAAGAYDALVGIPVIGPVIAPPAAIAAFAAVAAFKMMFSRRGEWKVENDDTPYILHKNETVLPAPIANPMRTFFENPPKLGVPSLNPSMGSFNKESKVNNNSENSTNVNFNISAIDGESVNKLLKKHGKGIVDSIHGQRRKNNYGLPA